MIRSITIPFDQDLLPAKQLTAENVTCLYEDGKIRSVKYKGHEVINMIYFAVRDDHWNTAAYIISRERIDSTADGFEIHYQSTHKFSAEVYKADVTIIFRGNSISYNVKGVAISTFRRNRIGICVLHPLTDSEPVVTISRPDGTSYQGVFPCMVSPHQPFKDIQKLQYNLKSVDLTFEFEGDIFETEDQRNWSDNSFKTYSTPHALPFPVDVQRGDAIHQQVKVIFKTNDENFLQKELPEERFSFPFIGYDRQHASLLNQQDLNILRQVPFDHYRVELSLKHDWETDLNHGLGEAGQLETKLELVLVSDLSQTGLSDVLDQLASQSAFIKSILFIEEKTQMTPGELATEVYQKIKSRFPGIMVGYGTTGNFADLNRNPPRDIPFDFLNFSLNPQVHAVDTRSVIGNLQSQRDMILAAQQFANGKPIFVSPVTMKIRDRSNEHKDEDPRQHSNFGASWTLAALSNLCEGGHVTFYQAVGYRGLIHSGGVSKLAEYLKEIKSFNPKWILRNSEQNKVVLENESGGQLEFNLDLPI